MKVQVIRTGESANVTSVVRALDFLDINWEVVEGPDLLSMKMPVLMPGVETYHLAISKLEKTGLADSIRDHNGNFAPLVGICLGMQLLAEEGHEEGYTEGLGLIQGSAIPFRKILQNSSGLNVGFRPVRRISKANGGDNHPSYYFAHSYFISQWLDSDVVSFGRFANVDFPAQVSRDGITGFQFHPELSGLAGLSLLEASLKI